MEENWSKVRESLKRVRTLQDEIDGEPLSPFVFSICITSDARPDSAQFHIHIWWGWRHIGKKNWNSKKFFFDGSLSTI